MQRHLRSEIDVQEDVDALLGGEELSEEFQEKAKIVFEAAIASKYIERRISRSILSVLAEEIAGVKSALNESVDSYLEYVAESGSRKCTSDRERTQE